MYMCVMHMYYEMNIFVYELFGLFHSFYVLYAIKSNILLGPLFTYFSHFII